MEEGKLYSKGETKAWTHPGGCQQVTYFEEAQNMEEHLVRQIQQLSWGNTLRYETVRAADLRLFALGIGGWLFHGVATGMVQQHCSGCYRGVPCLLPYPWIKTRSGIGGEWWARVVGLVRTLQTKTASGSIGLALDARNREAGGPVDELGSNSRVQICASPVHLVSCARPLALVALGLLWQ